jgi:tRNA1Val (adenine37-N6)-methyltransferase
VERILEPESCDLVVANPPYYPPRSGRTSIDEENFTARHQESKTLESFVSAAAFSIKNRGTVGFIYPADLLTDLLIRFQAFRLEPKTLQLIYSYAHDSADAKLAFVEAVKNGGAGLSVRTPLYIYQDKMNIYTETIEAMYDSRDNSSV